MPEPSAAANTELYATVTISVSAKDGYDPNQWDDDTIATAFAAAEQAVRNLLSREHFGVDSDAALVREVEAQQRDGWFCWGCARWLPAGTGVVRSRWPKFLGFGVGLYCGKKCAP